MAFLPTDVSGIALWLKADSLPYTFAGADGSGITIWGDSGPSGYTLNYTAGMSNQPKLKTNILNGLPVIRFEASNNQALWCSGDIALSELTFFSVFKSHHGTKGTIFSNSVRTSSVSFTMNYALHTAYTNASGWAMDVAKRNVTDNAPGFPVSNTSVDYINDWVIRADKFNAGTFDYSLKRNSSTLLSQTHTQAFTTTCSSSLNRFGVGAHRYLSIGSASDYYSGDIAELVIYNRALDSTEQLNVENYLKYKYFITSNGFPLYINAAAPTSSGNFTFFEWSTSNSGHYNPVTTLFASGAIPSITNSLTLYTASAEFTSGSVPLYTVSTLTSSSGMNLFEWGNTQSSGSFTLYEGGRSSGVINTTLFIAGATTPTQTAGINLYTTNYPSSGLFTLQEWGHLTSSGVHTLYTANWGRASGIFPLYMFASDFKSKGMSLYVKQTTLNKTNSTTLFAAVNSISSTPGTESMYKTTTLFTKSNINTNFSLYVKTDEFGAGNIAMPLYMKVRETLWDGSSNNIPLVIQNDTALADSRLVKLTIRGLGSLNGGLNYNKAMSLYIERQTNNGCPLFIQSILQSGSTPLYMFGAHYAQSGLRLVMNAGYYSGVKTSTLFTSGPSTNASGITMYVKGLPNVTANNTLYVNGF